MAPFSPLVQVGLHNLQFCLSFSCTFVSSTWCYTRFNHFIYNLIYFVDWGSTEGITWPASLFELVDLLFLPWCLPILHVWNGDVRVHVLTHLDPRPILKMPSKSQCCFMVYCSNLKWSMLFQNERVNDQNTIQPIWIVISFSNNEEKGH